MKKLNLSGRNKGATYDMKQAGSLDEAELVTFFENEIYTVKEAARLAKCCVKTIYRAIAAGHLREKRLAGGRGIRILGSELIGWMKGGNYA